MCAKATISPFVFGTVRGKPGRDVTFRVLLFPAPGSHVGDQPPHRLEFTLSYEQAMLVTRLG
jgi:hypothetical protein